MSAKQRIVIVGAGGHGAELLSYLADLHALDPNLELEGLVDDRLPPNLTAEPRVIGGVPALGRWLAERPGCVLHYITAVGDNAARRALVSRIAALGSDRLVPWTLRHPYAMVGRMVEIGAGTCLAPGSIVTSRVQIGRHCILNVKASVAHDCVVGDYVNINPGATVAGRVTLGEGSFVGAGATVINGVSIGAWSIIGAGATVIRDIPPAVTAVGVPARVIKRHTSGRGPTDA